MTEKRTSLSERLTASLQLQEEEKKQEIISDYINDKDTEEDYEYARKTIKAMVEVGKDAVDELKIVASESDQARHYEVLANLIKTTTENAEKLLDVRKKKKDLEKETPNEQQVSNSGVINNNTYIGTTAELLNIIKKTQEEKESLVDVTPEKEI